MNTYEAHITVDCNSNEQKERFNLECKNLKLKPVHIILEKGDYPSQLMSASYHTGKYEDIFKEISKKKELLQNSGFKIKRVKIEGMIDNDDIPEKIPDENYFEFHVKVTLDDEFKYALLKERCRNLGAHLARSATKIIEGKKQWFVTLRCFKLGREAAKNEFVNLIKELSNFNYNLSNMLEEYTVYDSNIAIDKGWYIIKRKPMHVLQRTGIISLSICGLLFLSLISFENSFNFLHSLFFEPGTWTFDPLVSNMKRMFPDQFFINIAMNIFLTYAFLGALFYSFKPMLAWILRRD